MRFTAFSCPADRIELTARLLRLALERSVALSIVTADGGYVDPVLAHRIQADPARLTARLARAARMEVAA
ncbi:hypothetical protein STSO111631_13325 [Stackebrandtia soli]